MIDKNWFNENDYRKVVSMYNNSKLDFQRFEFLGDRVLGLALAENLMTRFSEYDEGKLAKIFSYLSSRKVLVKIEKKKRTPYFFKRKQFRKYFR